MLESFSWGPLHGREACWIWLCSFYGLFLFCSCLVSSTFVLSPSSGCQCFVRTSFLLCSCLLLFVPSILIRHALFGFSADELSVVPRVFVYMLNVCKFCIWGARNDFRFRGVRPSAVDVMERVKSRSLACEDRTELNKCTYSLP